MSIALTTKQEQFCLHVVEGDTISDAYRKSFNTNATDKTVHEKASRIAAQEKIAARIAELRAPAAEQAKLTLTVHLAKLANLRDKAEEKENYSVAVQAEGLRGKAAGLYIDRSEVTGKNGQPLNPAAMSREEREEMMAQMIQTMLNRRKQRTA